MSTTWLQSVKFLANAWQVWVWKKLEPPFCSPFVGVAGGNWRCLPFTRHHLGWSLGALAFMKGECQIDTPVQPKQKLRRSSNMIIKCQSEDDYDNNHGQVIIIVIIIIININHQSKYPPCFSQKRRDGPAQPLRIAGQGHSVSLRP